MERVLRSSRQATSSRRSAARARETSHLAASASIGAKTGLKSTAARATARFSCAHVFTQPRSFATKMERPRYVRFPPDSDRNADIETCRKSANRRHRAKEASKLRRPKRRAARRMRSLVLSTHSGRLSSMESVEQKKSGSSRSFFFYGQGCRRPSRPRYVPDAGS
jgi:hypothetical protein